jgi:hypothetical protein
MSTSDLQLAEQLNIIMRQTDYSEEVAREKLIECNNSHIKVIKLYMGITDKPVAPSKAVKSVNQEIYKQIRYKLNESMQKYNEEQEKKLQKDIDDNFDR